VDKTSASADDAVADIAEGYSLVVQPTRPGRSTPCGTPSGRRRPND
jgi:hypothetical protein